MADVLFQFAALILFIAVVALAYRRFGLSRAELAGSRGVLVLITITMIDGLVGSTGWWVDDPRAFSWDLPPLAGRMLAAAAWAFAVGCFVTLRRPTEPRSRLILLMLVTYLLPLTVAIILFHLDKFDWSVPISYAFFALVALLLISSSWYLYQLPALPLEQSTAAPTPLAKYWLGVVALLTGLWGIALFITDEGPLSWLWVWPGDLLTSRLIAVMLLTLAVAALYSLRVETTIPMILLILATYGVGVALANVWSLTASKPIQPVYVAAFSLIGSFSALLFMHQSSIHKPIPSVIPQE